MNSAKAEFIIIHRKKTTASRGLKLCTHMRGYAVNIVQKKNHGYVNKFVIYLTKTCQFDMYFSNVV